MEIKGKAKDTWTCDSPNLVKRKKGDSSCVETAALGCKQRDFEKTSLRKQTYSILMVVKKTFIAIHIRQFRNFTYFCK